MSKGTPKSWRFLKISSFAVTSSGGTPDRKKSEFYKGSIHWVKSAELNDCRIYNTEEMISDVALKSSSTKVFPKNTVLVAMYGANIGKLGILKVEASTNQAICGIIPNEDVNYLYLYYYLKSIRQNLINKGVGGAQNNINQGVIRNLIIPVPPLEQQIKIASILEKAEKAIQKRKEADELVDKYFQSVFIEMFGDPATNPMGWEIGNIGQLTKKTQYGTSKKASETVQKFTVLRMNNITSKGNWDFSSLKYIDLNESEQAKYIVYKGEMLFNRTNSRELVGKTAVYRFNEPMAFAGYLVKLIPNNKANSEYISAYLNSTYGKKLLFRMAKNIVGMANINAEELKSINIMIPPIDLQNKFAEIVQKVETLKQKQKESTEELETLFKSLMQKAFRGELTDSDFDSVDTTEFSIENLKELIQSEFGNMEFDFEELSYAIRNQYKSTEYDDIKIALFACLEKRKNEYRPFLLQVFYNEKIHYKIN